MFAANLLNIIGYTFVMEAPSSEFLAIHPNTFWTFVKLHLRSNANPAGLELAQTTFYITFPLLMAVFIWAFAKGLSLLKNDEKN
jgi:hypothetical protein